MATLFIKGRQAYERLNNMKGKLLDSLSNDVYNERIFYYMIDDITWIIHEFLKPFLNSQYGGY